MIEQAITQFQIETGFKFDDPAERQILKDCLQEMVKQLKEANGNLFRLKQKTVVENVQLKARVRQLEKDNARLDWLEQNVELLPPHQGAPRTKRSPSLFYEPYQTLREAIDAAMGQPPRSPEEQAAAIRRKVGCKGNIMSEGAGLYAGDLSTPPRSAEDKQ